MRASVILRWTLALACIGGFAKFVRLGLATGGFGSAGYLLFGFSALISAVLFVAPDTATRLCELFSRIFTCLIFPDERFAKPPLSYLLAHLYRKQRRYAEAVAEYEKIIYYYPREGAAYHELIELCESLGDDRTAAKYRARLHRRANGKKAQRLPLGST